ncbi:DUF4124 domain-containing protein, partial [Pseudomonas aeruginosa]|uniref:DUF4124 domain-containing protein n=6 Tax=Pseudomonas aeruginosa TaxID=287 RepID=UPI001F23BECC
MRRMILPASLLLALSSFAMAAPIYKWVDAEGVTHFGAQPPQGAQATTVNTQTAPPPETASPWQVLAGIMGILEKFALNRNFLAIKSVF